MPFQRLISVSRLNRQGGTFVTHGDHELAVFVLGEPDGVVVIDNACPHASGNLSGGTLGDGAVTCPWHEWRFDLRTGVCTQSDRARVARYPVEIRGDDVWVDVGD